MFRQLETIKKTTQISDDGGLGELKVEEETENLHI